ncbi:hypothetical protein D3C71_2006130 [compost metagenome]
MAGIIRTPSRDSFSIFSKWMACSGVSRGTSTSGRPSLSITSAARVMRLSDEPFATAESVPMEHGMMIMPCVRNEPLAIEAPMSAIG